MSFKKLLERLFATNKDDETEIQLHIAGATVIHQNPFEDIEVPENQVELDEDFIEKWVVPFYMNGLTDLNQQTITNFKNIKEEITPLIVSQLLGEFGWRERIIGAYFSAIKNYSQFEEIIGNHLLKSEVCYAGGGYCLALACFNTDKSIEYLKRYLDYYLTRNDLWFDQSDALSALYYLDKESAEHYTKLWNDYIKDKPNHDIEKSKKHFDKQIQNIFAIREM